MKTLGFMVVGMCLTVAWIVELADLFPGKVRFPELFGAKRSAGIEKLEPREMVTKLPSGSCEPADLKLNITEKERQEILSTLLFDQRQRLNQLEKSISELTDWLNTGGRAQTDCFIKFGQAYPFDTVIDTLCRRIEDAEELRKSIASLESLWPETQKTVPGEIRLAIKSEKLCREEI